MKFFTELNSKVCFIALLMVIWVMPNSLEAQTTINASGGSQSISGGIYEYSIGEMTVVSTQSNANITVTQGLLQIDYSYLGVKEEPFSDQNLVVFPNPAENILHIKPSLNGSGGLSVKLFDLQGRLILQKVFFLQTGLEKQDLNLSSLQEGTYMLNVQFNHGKQSYHQNYKIIKFGNR